jgi:CelD/BcsL family acetyltransferase involved in cellulose biosynthesis
MDEGELVLPKDKGVILRAAGQKDQLRVTLVRSLKDLTCYADAWNRLALEAPQRLPMLSHAWITTYFKHRIKPGEEWYCLLASEGDDLIGVFPFIARKLRTMGLKRYALRTPHDWHTVSIDFLGAKGREAEVIQLLLSAIEKVVPQWYTLELKRLPDVSPTLGALKSSSSRVYVLQEYDGEGCFIRLNENFESFYSRLGRDLRRKLRARARKLQETADVQMITARGRDECARYLDKFIVVEGAGRKGKGGAIKLDIDLVSFYRALVSELAELGWMEWYILRVGDRPISFSLALKLGRNRIIFKSCYDEEYGGYSPGNLIIERIVKKLYLSGDTDELNYLTDMPQHRYWHMDSRSYYNLYIYPRRVIPLLFSAFRRKMQIVLGRNQTVRSVYRILRSAVRGMR